jgi:G5 domain
MNREQHRYEPKPKHRVVKTATLIVVLIIVLWLIARWFARYNYTAPAAVQSTPRVASEQTNVRKETIIETELIPFQTDRVDDPEKFVGSSTVIKPGAYGVKTLTYEVSTIDGVQTSKQLLGESVTTAPVNQILSVGTKTSQ